MNLLNGSFMHLFKDCYFLESYYGLHPHSVKTRKRRAEKSMYPKARRVLTPFGEPVLIRV